jgi:hypothetical protein
MVKNMYVARSNDTMYRYAFLWPSDLGNKMPFELLGCTCGKLLAEGLCITFLKSTYKKKKKGYDSIIPTNSEGNIWREVQTQAHK